MAVEHYLSIRMSITTIQHNKRRFRITRCGCLILLTSDIFERAAPFWSEGGARAGWRRSFYTFGWVRMRSVLHETSGSLSGGEIRRGDSIGQPLYWTGRLVLVGWGSLGTSGERGNGSLWPRPHTKPLLRLGLTRNPLTGCGPVYVNPFSFVRLLIRSECMCDIYNNNDELRHDSCGACSVTSHLREA